MISRYYRRDSDSVDGEHTWLVQIGTFSQRDDLVANHSLVSEEMGIDKKY